jgi:hypothetical protein
VDVDIFSDRKVRRVMAACGAAAMGVVLRVLCDIYGEQGYYLRFDDNYCFDVADTLGVEESYVREVVRCCMDTDFFDLGLFERFGILTSRRVQRNYLDATVRRYDVALRSDYLLLDVSKTGENVYIEGDTVYMNAKNVYAGTQSKVKQSKAEESKQDHAADAGGGDPLSFGDYVSMGQEEHAALVRDYGEAGAARMIEMLGDYKAASGKAYASDYHAIRAWVVKRWREEQTAAQRPYYERPAGNYDYLAVDPFAEEGDKP